MRHRRLGVPIAVGLALGLLLVFGLARSEQAVALESDEGRLLDLINAYRAENGLGALSPSPTLQTAAERHSEDMSTYGFFSHTTQASSYYAVGSGHADRVQAEGYPSDSYTAENLAVDYATPEEVLVAWQNSPGHNSALLDGSYSAAGIGHVGAYWTLNLGSISGATQETEPETPPADEEQYEEPEAQEEQYEEPEAQEAEPGAADDQYEDQYDVQDQYDEEAAGEESGSEETTEETSDEEGTTRGAPAATQYEEGVAEEETAEAEEPAATTEDETEAPSDEDIERYVAEMLAAEEQYDAQDASGSSDEAGEEAPTPKPTAEPTGRAPQEADALKENDFTEAPEVVEEPEVEISAPEQPATEPATAAASGEDEPAPEAEEVAGESDEPSESDGSEEESVYGIAVLPNTGGSSVAMLALGLLLVCGGLVSRRALR